MIIGIGTDLCDIRRIEKSLKRFGRRFVERLYGENEQAKAERRPSPASSYAQSFAAKEACAKALGTGFRDGVFWRDMVVANHPTGQPFMVLSGGAKVRLDSLVPVGMEARIDVSQSDEYPMAQAVVVISAVPLVVPPGVPQTEAP
ncbi:MAG: holo-ACP synthase [Rhodospirillales bacterium]|nr:holo-ACP synthase [Rhodospirillales bacterium]